jgi:hypothetical protein
MTLYYTMTSNFFRPFSRSNLLINAQNISSVEYRKAMVFRIPVIVIHSKIYTGFFHNPKSWIQYYNSWEEATKDYKHIQQSLGCRSPASLL